MSGNEDDRSVPPPSYSEAISDPRYMASGAAPASGPGTASHSSQSGFQAPPTSYQSPPTSYQSPPTSYQSPPTNYQATPTSYQAPPTGYQAPPTGYQAPPTGFQTPPAGYQAAPSGVQSTPSSSPYPGQSGCPTQTTITYNPYQGNVQCGNLPQGFATTPLAYGNSGQRQEATRFNKICITVICCFVVVSVFIFTMAMALGMH